MLTTCPECQKELSTAATQCPHCGAPVSHGHLSGGESGKPPMAKAVPQAYPAQPGYPQPGYPQAGYPQPGGPPQQPKSNCLRNCLIFGCLLVFLGIAAFVGLTWYAATVLKQSVATTPAEIAAIGQKVAPGATTPTGYTEKFGLNVNMFGQKWQGAFISNGSGDPNESTIIAWGALNVKPQDKKQLEDSFEKALQAGQGGGGRNGPNSAKKIDLEETVELQIGGEAHKVLHMVATDQNSGAKTESYFVILDPWNNEFGWLGVGASGPEGKFDLDGFKAFLAKLKK
jgi:hypothetical protein